MLSMTVISEALEASFKILSVSRSGAQAPMNLTGAAMYTSGPTSDDTVYIAEARRLPVSWKRTEHISIIVAGEIREGYFAQSDVDCICVEDTRIACVLNTVLAVFRDWALVNDSIKNAIINGAELETACEAFSAYIQNPVVVFDQSLRVLYKTSDAAGLFEWEEDAISGMKLLPADFVNQMYQVRKSRAAAAVIQAADPVREYGESVLLCGGSLRYNLICATGKGGAYSLLVFETTRPLSPGVFELANQISGLILSALDASRKNSGTGGMTSFIIAMLDKTKFSKFEIDVYLENAGWKSSDNCCCIVLIADNNNKDKIYNSTFCLRLGNQFRSCVTFIYKENVVAVVNLDKSDCTVRDIPNRIGVLLKDGLFHAGISFRYWDFVTTPAHFEQACSACEIGEIYSPSAWCYQFEDYAMRYLMHYGFSRIPAFNLCHPGLIALYVYDKENNTELLPTLKAYVNCCCRAALTAKKLYIHRNTFYQRLSKIQELLDLDLENQETRLYIQLSYYFMDMYNYELANGLL